MSWCRGELPPPSRRHGTRGADQVQVALGQAVGLLAVANGGKVACIELREAEKLQNSVRGSEPVPREVFVDNFAGLDAR